jgi:hypothetical protein
MADTMNTGAQQMVVKRLLRRQNTREYFKDDDGWTENPDEARCFSDVVEAAETCARLGLKGVELTLREGSDTSDLFCTPIR